MRTCHCTGHLTNPGGVCCMDLRQGITVDRVRIGKAIPMPLTEGDVRRIIREELRKALRHRRP